MSRKPEAVYAASVHRHIRLPTHFEGMANPFRGGTWDNWFDGPATDMWIEYKWRDHLPKCGVVDLMDLSKKPCLSKLQQVWGKDRYENGRIIAVVLGTKDGGVIYTHCAWEKKWTSDVLVGYLLERKTVALFINTVTLLTPGSSKWYENMSSISILGGPPIAADR